MGAAVAAALGLMVGAPVAGALPRAEAAPATVTSTTSTAGAASTAQAPAGWTTAPAKAPKARTAVPWKSVRKGWVVFTSQEKTRNVLYLASPQGQAYEIARIPGTWSVADVRPDGRAAVIIDGNRAQVVDLVTGAKNRIIPTGWSVRFTRPTGAALISVEETRDGSRRLVRYSYDGSVQLSRPTSALYVAARPEGGQTLVGQLGNRGVPISNGTFKSGAPYTLPQGYSDCTVTGIWDASSVLQACTDTKGRSALFSQRVSGGAPVTQVAGALPPSYAWSGAWATRAGTVAHAAFYLPAVPAARAASPLTMVYLVAKGKRTQIALPPDHADMRLRDVDEGRLYFVQDSYPAENASPRLTVVEPGARRITAVTGKGTKIPGRLGEHAVFMVGSRDH